MTYPKLAGLLLLGPMMAMAVAACGSSGPPKAPPSTPATSSALATSAAAKVRADWEKFFDAKTAAADRVKLLQNGPQFLPVIRAQAGSSLASAASATVTKVQITGPGQAKVTYTILISGQPALRNQTGTAVWQDGTWKVGTASFCGLLTLENGGKTAGLPAGCHTGTS
jgi:hypothetical protein